MIRKFILASILLFVCVFTASAQWNGQTTNVQPDASGKYVVNGYVYSLKPGPYFINNKHYTLLEPAPAKEEVKADDTPPPAPKDPDDSHRSPVAPVKTEKTDTKSVKTDKTHSKEEVIKSIQDNTQLPPHVKKEILENLLREQAPTSPPTADIKQEPALSSTLISTPEPLSFSIVTLAPPKESTSRILETTFVKAAERPFIETPKTTTQPEKFDLLQAFKKGSSTPAVKTYSEETPPLKAADPPRTEPKKEEPKKSEPKSDKKDFILLPMGATDPPATPDPAGFDTPATDIGISVGSKIDFTTPWDPSKPVPYGKLLQFWVKPVTKRPDKLKSVAYTWTVLPKEDIILWPDTTRIIFSSGSKPQSYVVMLTASYVFLDGDRIVQRTAQSITMVQVGDGSQPPTGGAGGFPPAPSDLSGVSKQAYEWTATVVRNGTYDDSKVKADAKKLAAAFKSIADKIDGAQLTDINDILNATKTENDKALVDNRNEWLPWFTKMSDLLKAGFRDNTIRTPQQYSQVWKDIVKGLDAASK